jgi:hypothetical protein
MTRIVHISERSCKVEPPKVVTLVAKTPTTILADLIQPQVPNVNMDYGYEVGSRFIFNDTGAKLYYAIGVDKCDDTTSYHGAIADQTLLNCTDFGGGMVTVYSVAGGKVSTIVVHRQDLHSHKGAQSQPAIRT